MPGARVDPSRSESIRVLPSPQAASESGGVARRTGQKTTPRAGCNPARRARRAARGVRRAAFGHLAGRPALVQCMGPRRPRGRDATSQGTWYGIGALDEPPPAQVAIAPLRANRGEGGRAGGRGEGAGMGAMEGGSETRSERARGNLRSPVFSFPVDARGRIRCGLRAMVDDSGPTPALVPRRRCLHLVEPQEVHPSHGASPEERRVTP